MDSKHTCPYCRQSIAFEADMAGEHVPCPACERLIQLPTANEHPAPALPAVAVSMHGVASSPLPKTSGMAIASMVVGIVSFFGGFLCCGVVLPIVAIVLGHVSYAQISNRPNELTGKGFAIAGFTIGYTGLLLGLLYSIMMGTFSAFFAALAAVIEEAMRQSGSLP